MAGRLFPAGGGASISLTKRIMVIGRAYGCDIRFDNPVVSNSHLRLEFDGRSWTVEDLGSRNGTVVNALPVRGRQAVKSGETITVSAKYRLVIEYDPAVERRRFAAIEDGAENVQTGDDRTHLEHGPATTRLEPHDRDVWSQMER